LIASILSKKIAVGSKYVLIDIPYGHGAKVSHKGALRLKHKFEAIGKLLKLKVSVVLTDGSQPIGNGLGPVLEIKDVLRVLQRNSSPLDLESKSVMLAGKLLEMVGKCKKGNGKKMAQQILDSGAAFQKFRNIIKSQDGNAHNLPIAKFNHTYHATKSGTIKRIDNKDINRVCRIAGCPQDKPAGLYLYKHCGSRVRKGEPLVTLYAESEQKLKEALNYLKETDPIAVE